MRGLYLYVTRRCNLSCKYCYVRRDDKDLSLEDGQKAISLFLCQEGDIKEIIFFGGEPLLKFELIKKLVDFSRQESGKLGKAVKFAVTTNGVLLTREIAAYLMENNFSIQVSIDGEPVINSATRPRKDMKPNHPNFDLLKEIKPYVRLTVTPENSASLHGSFRYFIENGFLNLGIEPSIGVQWDKRSCQAFSRSIKQIEEIYLNYFFTMNPIRIKYINLYLETFYGGVTFSDIASRRCSLCDYIAVDPEGNIGACDTALESYYLSGDRKFLIGDLKHGLDTDSVNSWKNFCLKSEYPEYDLPYMGSYFCMARTCDGKKMGYESFKYLYEAKLELFRSAYRVFKALKSLGYELPAKNTALVGSKTKFEVVDITKPNISINSELQPKVYVKYNSDIGLCRKNFWLLVDTLESTGQHIEIINSIPLMIIRGISRSPVSNQIKFTNQKHIKV